MFAVTLYDRERNVSSVKDVAFCRVDWEHTPCAAAFMAVVFHSPERTGMLWEAR